MEHDPFVGFSVKMPESMLKKLDDWRRAQPDLPNRSEAIRRLIKAGMSLDQTPAIADRMIRREPRE